MRIRLATFLCGLVLVTTPGLSAATLFNVRASLEDRYLIAGAVAIDPVLGLVTGETTTLSRDGVAISNFGGPSSQGPFTPGGGIASSYLFTSQGSGGYLFVGAVPGTSLVGYAGGELCGVLSASHCAYADVFQGSTGIANVLQGILLPASDRIETFALTGTFENGDNVTGTVVIDTTTGYVLDEHATLFSHGVVVDEYFGTLQSIFAPGGGVSTSYLLQSTGLAGGLLNLGVPGSSLIDYAGGDLCATGNGLTCAYSDLYAGSTFLGNAITARLERDAAVPEPSTALLLVIGLVGLAARRRSSMTIHLRAQRFGRLGAALLSACLLTVTSAPGVAASLSIGTPLSLAPSYLPPLPADTFLVPVEVSGAVGLQTWQFSLRFDSTVVEEVDPFDGSAGIYGARFTADPDTMSFVLGGFPLNGLGLVDSVAGAYPDLVDGVTGDGTLVFVLFTRLPGQDGNDPGFVITDSDVGPGVVPEPATWMLVAPALVLLGLTRRRAGAPVERRRPIVRIANGELL